MARKSFNCVIIGDGSLVIPCGEYILQNKGEILAVITSAEHVNDWCKEKMIPVVSELCISELQNYSFDYLFSIVHFDLIPEKILRLPKKLAINYHDALLPKYAGIHATSWALMHGERRHGITWHVMNSEIDAGSILIQKSVVISQNETAYSLNLKCFQAALEGFHELIDNIICDTVTYVSQDLSKRSYFGKWKKPDCAGLIDWEMSENQIIKFVHSLSFGDYDNTLATAKIYFDKQFYIVDDIERFACDFYEETGIAKIEANSLIVSTKNGPVAIKKLKNITGENVDLNKIFDVAPKKFDLTVSKSESKKFEDCINKVSRKEAYWVKKLDDAYLSKKNSILNDMVIDLTFSIALNQIKQYDLTIIERLLFVIRQILKHTTKSDEYYIGYKDDSLVGYNLCADKVPLCIRINDSENVVQMVEQLKAELEQTKKGITFVNDVYSRYSVLKGKIFLPTITIYSHGGDIDMTSVENSGLVFLVDEKRDELHCFNKDNTNEGFVNCIIKGMEILDNKIMKVI